MASNAAGGSLLRRPPKAQELLQMIPLRAFSKDGGAERAPVPPPKPGGHRQPRSKPLTPPAATGADRVYPRLGSAEAQRGCGPCPTESARARGKSPAIADSGSDNLPGARGLGKPPSSCRGTDLPAPWASEQLGHGSAPPDPTRLDLTPSGLVTSPQDGQVPESAREAPEGTDAKSPGLL